MPEAMAALGMQRSCLQRSRHKWLQPDSGVIRPNDAHVTLVRLALSRWPRPVGFAFPLAFALDEDTMRRPRMVSQAWLENGGTLAQRAQSQYEREWVECGLEERKDNTNNVEADGGILAQT